MSEEIRDMFSKLEKNINDRLNKQDEMMQQLIIATGSNNERLNNIDKRLDNIDGKLDRIEAAANRLEHNEPENIVAILKQINSKLDDRDYELQALNKRLFKNETEIERLTRQ